MVLADYLALDVEVGGWLAGWLLFEVLRPVSVILEVALVIDQLEPEGLLPVDF